MPSFDIDIEFEVYCATCGAGLCGQSDGSQGRQGPRVDVEVCDRCLDSAKDEAYEAGYEAALKELEATK